MYVFRIVEHTNYHLSSILTDNGYGLEKCGVVCEGSLTGNTREVCMKMPDGSMSDIGMEENRRRNPPKDRRTNPPKNRRTNPPKR